MDSSGTTIIQRAGLFMTDAFLRYREMARRFSPLAGIFDFGRLCILDLQRDVRLPRSNTETCHRGTLYRRRLHTTVIVGPQFPWV
jgi:hypothetical protein